MISHGVEVFWQRGAQPFVDHRYSRKHLLRFDGGAEVAGSSSPHVVAVPMSDAEALDPEECFVAALASCHMLWFLSIAADRGFRIDEYQDRAGGELEKNAEGKLAITRVTLRPRVRVSGTKLPSRHEFEAMHHDAHDRCFIANSVKTEILCEPALETAK